MANEIEETGGVGGGGGGGGESESRMTASVVAL